MGAIDAFFDNARRRFGGGNQIKSKPQLENELLQAEINKIKADEKRADQTGAQAASFASQFFDKWNTSMAETKGIYNRAIAAANQAQGFINKTFGDVGKIDEIVAQLGQEYESFSQQYGGLEQDAIDTGREQLGAERALTGRIMDYSREDAGVGDRAAADVGNEAEKMRRAQAIQMQSLGIDPASGRFAGNMRRNRVDTAINKALAANKARLDEKVRAGNYSIAGMNAIDAAGTTGIATNIASGKRDLLGMQTGAAQTAIDARTQLAGQAGNIAGTIGNIGANQANTVTMPQGEMFGSTFGTAMENKPTALNPRRGGVL